MPYKDPEKKREANRRSEAKRKEREGARHRAWTLICYPDSMPDDWAEELSQVHIPVWVSPLHDQDVWTSKDERENPKHKAGTPKKPHYHVIAQYPEKHSREQFLDDFGFLRGPQNVKAVESMISMVRYLVHADDPDKAQYSRDDMRVFCGADPGLLDELGTHERHEVLKAMRRFIREHDILYFDEFSDYCDDCETTWANLLDDSCTYRIHEYIKARAARIKDQRAEWERNRR